MDLAQDSDNNDPCMKELDQDDSEDWGATEMSEHDAFDSDDPLHEKKKSVSF